MKRILCLAVMASILLASCNNEPSLQKYYVEKTENKNFIAVDLSPNMFNIDETKLAADEKAAVPLRLLGLLPPPVLADGPAAGAVHPLAGPHGQPLWRAGL